MIIVCNSLSCSSQYCLTTIFITIWFSFYVIRRTALFQTLHLQEIMKRQFHHSPSFSSTEILMKKRMRKDADNPTNSHTPATNFFGSETKTKMISSFYKAKNSQRNENIFASVLNVKDEKSPKWVEVKEKKFGIIILSVNEAPHPILIHLSGLEKQPLIRIIANTEEEARSLPDATLLLLKKWITNHRALRDLKGVLIHSRILTFGANEMPSDIFISEIFHDLLCGITTVEYLDKAVCKGRDLVLGTKAKLFDTNSTKHVCNTRIPEYLTGKHIEQSRELKNFLKEINVPEKPIPLFKGNHLTNEASRKQYIWHVQQSQNDHQEQVARHAKAVINDLKGKLNKANNKVEEMSRERSKIREEFYKPCSKCNHVRQDPGF